MRHRSGNGRGLPNVHIIIYALFNKGVHEVERGEIYPKNYPRGLWMTPSPRVTFASPVQGAFDWV